MDVELALKINRLVHNECKDVPHDIGLRIEELVRLHQIKLKNCSIPAVVGRSEQLKAFAEKVNNYYNGGCGTADELIDKMNSL